MISAPHGPQVEQNPRMSIPPPAPDPPLIDDARLASLKFMPAGKLPALFAQVLASGEAVVAEARAPGSALQQAAHRVKGSAGTVGLARLAALAGRLEAAAKVGETDAEALQAFAQALEASRAQLRDRGLLAA